MLRCRSEQAWHTNTPNVSDAQSGSGGVEKDKKRRREAVKERKMEVIKCGATKVYGLKVELDTGDAEASSPTDNR